MDKRKELIVSAIENGTVIDHIPADKVFEVIRILDFEHSKNSVYFGTNLDSKKYGKKGIIKISEKYFEPEVINKIAKEPTDTKKYYLHFGVLDERVARETIRFIEENNIISIDYYKNIDNYPQHEKLILKFDELLDKYLPEDEED